MKRLTKLANKMNEWHGSVNAKIAENREILVMGSVLDPLNHPSYSETEVAKLKQAREDYADLNEALKADLGLD